MLRDSILVMDRLSLFEGEDRLETDSRFLFFMAAIESAQEKIQKLGKKKERNRVAKVNKDKL